ncbi:hypothetical protein FGO68_gene15395 [Halteria grandinella]|uniref:Uncharacterized protein n=1 Tax=Halteria grandinella TaxID=5974 RepID=A0A8J8T303_HALGN|nr:hypothetical protein FGO68_gene15395 [Halteria grandinella]
MLSKLDKIYIMLTKQWTTIFFLLFSLPLLMAYESHGKQYCFDDQTCDSMFKYCDTDQAPLGGEWQGVCEHKRLFPMLLVEFIGCFLIIILAIISNAAGTAGGGVVIPLVMIFFGWDTKMGISISNFTVIFTAIARYLLEFNATDKVKGYGTVIKYDYILLTIPPLKVGSAIGAIVNQIIPELVIVIVLVALLIVMFGLTTHRAVSLYRGETKKKGETHKMEVRDEGSDGKETPQSNHNREIRNDLPENKHDVNQTVMPEDQSQQIIIDSQSADQTQALAQIIKEDSTHWQWKKLIVIWIMMAQLFTISIVRGNSQSGIEKCSSLDWGLFALILINSVILEIVAIVMIKKQSDRRRRQGYKFLHGDIQCTFPIISRLLISSLFAGFSSSAFGVGLALILTPILMALGLDPVASAATEIYQAFYSTLTSTMIVIVLNGMNFEYAIVSIIMAIIGAAIGIKVQSTMLKRLGRPSIMVFLLAFCILFCLVLIPLNALPKLIKLHEQGQPLFEANNYCSTVSGH